MGERPLAGWRLFRAGERGGRISCGTGRADRGAFEPREFGDVDWVDICGRRELGYGREKRVRREPREVEGEIRNRVSSKVSRLHGDYRFSDVLYIIWIKT